MKIVDVHTHVFPQKIAAQALAHLREKSCGIPVFADGTAEGLAAKARAAGYTAWINCPVVTRPDQTRSVNDWVAKQNSLPMLSMGGLHPALPAAEEEISRIHQLGLHGVKFHPEYQEFFLLEPRMEPIWQRCEELALPVIIHAGQDIGFEPPFHSSPQDFVELSRRHPGLTIIAAHLGGWRCWDEVEEHLVGSRVLMDTAFAKPFMRDPQQLRRIIGAHGSDKVLFGTDSPWQDLQEAVADIKGLALPAADLERIFWGNAARIWPLLQSA
jgi:predicted TIM-barrel fold metal-dependent hydrolase